MTSQTLAERLARWQKKNPETWEALKAEVLTAHEVPIVYRLRPELPAWFQPIFDESMRDRIRAYQQQTATPTEGQTA